MDPRSEKSDDGLSQFSLSGSFTPPSSYNYSNSNCNSNNNNYYKVGFDHIETSTRSPRFFDRYFSSSSSSDDDNDQTSHSVASSNSIQSTSKRLDCMLQFLDRKLSPNQGSSGSLPEFVAKGGGTGIFKLPVRAAVHSLRPPSLELRPHPLRETQIGRFLRTILSAESQLWAGSECGVRFWNFKDLYASPCGAVRIGDEETAPFWESAWTSPALCLVADEGNRLVWSGHKDGKIRCWKMDQKLDENGNTCYLKDSFSWQAHRGPVLSLIISSYGDLWSGSEGGDIKVWPWEAIEKSISLTREERHMAALMMERSYIDLRTPVTANASCGILNWDFKYLLSDHSRAKVWSAGYFSFALWDARTRELIKVFNIDGQIENRLEMSSLQDFSVEYVSGSKKEKGQSSIGFFQRSRNAIMGAADVVRRVAVKGAFGDDTRRIEALAITIDGCIWTGCTSGLLVLWDGNGNHLHDLHYHSSAVQCICSFGTHIWVGYVTGIVQVLDLEGNLLGGWLAHSSPVVKMTVGAGFMFTLANHGGIRGWNITSPGPLDDILRSELGGKDFLYMKIESLKLMAGTWNVGQGKATHDSLISWLGSMVSDVSIVVVGLQEVEMGAGFLAMSAAKETVGLEGSSVGQWWLDMIGKILDEGSAFERVGSRQLAGLLIAVWVRHNIRSYVGDVDVAAVPCGFGRALGNKGAVGLRIRIYDRIMCFVNCHFAAHLDAVNRRNADFDHVYRSMTFTRPTNLLNAAVGTVLYILLFCSLALSMYLFWPLYRSRLPLLLLVAAGTSSSVQMLRSANAIGDHSMEGMPEISDADMIVFLGDFNYRLDGISFDEARDFISQRCFDWLREKDQLRAEMQAGNVFQGMREALITFPPTYKFERHQAGLAGYDAGEKKRVPAWCDRILYRDSRSSLEVQCSLECPVVSSVVLYEACMDVTDSDHKPVRCIFNVDLARVDESIRRQEFGDILGSNENFKQLLEELHRIPETIVSTNNIILPNKDKMILRITNKCSRDNALFEIICEGQSTIKEDRKVSVLSSRGSFGFPRWLEVTPARGIIRPNQIFEVSICYEEFLTLEEFVDGVPQNWWCEDSRDKEVILVIKVRSCWTGDMRNHRLRVCHFFSSRKKPMDLDSNSSGRVQGSVLHRSDVQHLSGSYDVVHHLQNLHTP